MSAVNRPNLTVKTDLGEDFFNEPRPCINTKPIKNFVKQNIKRPLRRLFRGDEDQIVRSVYTIAKGAVASMSGVFSAWLGVEFAKAVAHQNKDSKSKSLRVVSKIVIHTADMGLVLYGIVKNKEAIASIKEKNGSVLITNKSGKTNEIKSNNTELAFYDPVDVGGPWVEIDDGEWVPLEMIDDYMRENDDTRVEIDGVIGNYA